MSFGLLVANILEVVLLFRGVVFMFVQAWGGVAWRDMAAGQLQRVDLHQWQAVVGAKAGCRNCDMIGARSCRGMHGVAHPT